MYLYVFSAYPQVFWKEIQADTYRYALQGEVHIYMYLVHIIKFSGMKYRQIPSDTYMYLHVFLINVLKIQSDMHTIHQGAYRICTVHIRYIHACIQLYLHVSVCIEQFPEMYLVHI